MTKKKILLIDDENSFCVLLKANLEGRANFEVITALNGDDGIRLARDKHPDLILLDILMPGMDGMAVAANLKSNKRTKEIPIAFLTALANEEEVRQIKGKTGENYILAKLVSTEELIGSINNILGAA